jgi:glycogen synthase
MSDPKQLRFAYLSGPVNAVEVHDAWAKESTLEYFGTSYLRQFYQICADFGAKGYVITSLPLKHKRQCIGSFVIENRPPPSKLSGFRYHFAYSLWMIKILPSMVHFRPDILILTEGHNYWVFLSILRIFGVVMIPAQHDALWKRFVPLKMSWRVLRALKALFFAGCIKEIMVAAESTAEQVRALVPRKKLQIEVFLPTYDRQQFSLVRSPTFETRPFNVLFMGRIETNKGIYDLLEIASSLSQREFHFDMCGAGTEMASLRQTIEARGLSSMVRCHGFLNREQLYAIIDQTHAVIVPTTTDFEEGFNMVCAEAVLCGRPVITSAVCPALTYIRDAAIEVPPNDVRAYREAVVKLATDRHLYEEKRLACKLLEGQFCNANNSWGAKLRILLQRHIVVRPS